MVPERERAMQKLYGKLHKVDRDGLRAAEARVKRCEQALAAFIPTTTGPAIAKERRAFEADLFYAIVDRDAYRIVLNQIEPPTPKNKIPKPPSDRHARSPNGVRPHAASQKLGSYRYRMKGARRALTELESVLAQAIETRAGRRAKVDACAANTYLLRKQHAAQQAERRLLFGPNARAPRGIVAAVRASVDEWTESYAAWKRADAEVRRVRMQMQAKLKIADTCERNIAAILALDREASEYGLR